jgi:hypothetical protein
MRAKSGLFAFVLASMTITCSVLRAAPIAPGPGQQTIGLNGIDLRVFTYRPRCANPSALEALAP